MKIWTIKFNRNNFPRAAIKTIMQIKIIAASVEKIIFARFVIPIIALENQKRQEEARTEIAITRH